MRSENKDDGSTAVIVANGKYPHHPVPLSVIKNAPYIVCCDGAANHFIEAGATPSPKKTGFASRISYFPIKNRKPTT